MAVRLWDLRTDRASLTRNDIFCLWYSFLSEADKPLGLVQMEGLSKLKINLIESGTRDLPAFSVAPQPLRYRVSSN
jgi:hypothetical protein